MTKHILIDADTLTYRAVFSEGGDTVGGVIIKLRQIIEKIIDSIKERYGNNADYTLYLTGSNNFRKDISKDYKANRPKEKPALLEFARNYVLENYKSVLTEGEEADDAIAIAATDRYPDAVIVSVDKDFRQVPSTIYNPNKDEWEDVDEWSGLSFFYEQMLVGDTADNVKGVWKVGPAKAKKLFAEATTELDLWKITLEAYEGDYDRAVMNGRLLWLRRQENQLWSPPNA